MERIAHYLPEFEAHYKNMDIPWKADRAAVIVEPRCHIHLNLAIKNVLYFLSNEPEKWSLYIFHSKENEFFVKELLGSADKIACIHLICIAENNLTLRDYCVLLASEFFWNWIQSEWVLIFQTDTYLRKNGIEDFIKEGYAYVGAPWANIWQQDEKQAGNGGLSLRHKPTMLRVIRDHPFTSNCNEDLYFHYCLRSMDNVRLPLKTRAKEFSVETLYYADPIGVHKYWEYVDKYDVEQKLSLIALHKHAV